VGKTLYRASARVAARGVGFSLVYTLAGAKRGVKYSPHDAAAAPWCETGRASSRLQLTRHGGKSWAIL